MLDVLCIRSVAIMIFFKTCFRKIVFLLKYVFEALVKTNPKLTIFLEISPICRRLYVHLHFFRM